MKKALLIAVCMGIATVGLVGCKSTLKEAGAVEENGSFVFSASAHGVSLDPSDHHDLAKAKVAARVNAKAALLEQIKGARINSEATVADLLLTSQEAQLLTRGWLSRATISYETTEPDRLGDVDQPGIITATATLKVTRAELRELAMYVD